jgi:bacteriorhodopsin
MLLSAAAFTVMSWRVPVSRRVYHVITTLITIIAAISYYAMATKSGVNWHHIHKTEGHKHGIPDTHHDIYRQVYWARYVDWSLTTPLLLLDLSLLAGLNGAHIIIAIVADLIMVLTGLFAAYGRSRADKWGWYTMACIAFLVVIYQLVVNGSLTSKAKGNKVGKFFAAISLYTILIWTAYPM